MKYFLISTSTAFCGEENDYYVKMDEKKNYDLDYILQDLVYENAVNWYDETHHEMPFDEYLEECSYSVDEITEEEYNDAKKDGKQWEEYVA